jgi:segregation and condensation protein A
MAYLVKLEAFEGPLDLLLHLINRLEIDIYDIPMAELTGQYIEHIQAMRVLQLDELSEYLVLAATLIEIKSKMLLPVHEGEEFDEDFSLDEEDDPRYELVARLIEYRKYKEAAISLKGSAEERSEHFTKSPEDLTEFGEIVAVETEDSLNVFDLIGAFQKMLDRKRLKAPVTASISKTEVSLSEKMDEIMVMLERGNGKCDFYTLFEKGETTELVVTFLSLLELMKRGDVIVEQNGNFDDLTVAFRREDE